MLRIATPISHLFKRQEAAKRIIKHSDCLECREHDIFQDFEKDKEELFHCDLEPIHPMKEEEFDFLAKVIDKKRNLKLISFHMASSCEKSTIKNGMFVPVEGTKHYEREEMLDLACQNFDRIKRIVGDNMILCVENNNYYPTESYKYVTNPDFIYQVVMDNNLMFLLDIAHAKISSHNQGSTYEAYKSKLPLDRLIQIHICQYAIDDMDMAYDAHGIPEEDTYTEIKQLITDYKNLKYLTVEYYKDEDNLINIIQNLRMLIK